MTRPNHRLTELESGLRIATERIEGLRSVAVGFFIGVGSRYESHEQAGLAHLLEHLLFRGTERYESSEIDELFDSMGAELNASTDREATTVYGRMLDEHIPQAIDAMADMVWRPAFKDIEPERAVVCEEIAMYEDDPQENIFDVLGRAIFGDHPLGRPIIGRAGVVSDTSIPNISTFHRHHYKPSSVVLAASGNVDHDQLVELATQTAPVEFEATVDRKFTQPELVSSQAIYKFKETEQFHVCLGGRALARSDDRRFDLQILDAIFGGLSSSRLFQAVRERQGLAYSVFSFAAQFHSAGELGIYLGTRRDNLEQALKIITTEIDRLCEEGVTQVELDRARENVKARMLMALEAPWARAARLGGSLLHDVPLLSLDELVERIEAVTLESLHSLATDLWSRDRLSIAGIGPDKGLFESGANLVMSKNFEVVS